MNKVKGVASAEKSIHPPKNCRNKVFSFGLGTLCKSQTACFDNPLSSLTILLPCVLSKVEWGPYGSNGLVSHLKLFLNYLFFSVRHCMSGRFKESNKTFLVKERGGLILASCQMPTQLLSLLLNWTWAKNKMIKFMV